MSGLTATFDFCAETQIPVRRVRGYPTPDTFDCPPIREFVKRYMAQSTVSVDPFARNKRWASYTNDLNTETTAECHMDALSFLETLITKGIEVDLVILDPPYSPRQMQECYQGIGLTLTMRDTQRPGRWTKEKALIDQLLKPSGIVLSFGWNSIGMGRMLRYDIVEILLVCHGGAHNDTICVAERKRARLTDLESAR